MRRTQIQLTERQYRSLKERAHRNKVSLSEAIRQAVDHWLRAGERQRAVERSLANLGRFRSGHADVSQRHDDYLADAYAKKGK